MAPKARTYKGKILFLHGFTQTSATFYAKTSALRKKLQKLSYKPVYLNGPLTLSPSDFPSKEALEKFQANVTEDGEAACRAWWLRRDLLKDGADLKDAIKTVKDYVLNGEIVPDPDLQQTETDEEKNLPILGIIGFSQGAALGGIISHHFDKIFHTDPLKFAVLYSGFKVDKVDEKEVSQDAKYLNYSSEGLDTRLLIVQGELDTVVEEQRVLALYDANKESSDILKHPGGHFVPNSKGFVDQVTNWIQLLDVKKNDNEDETKNDELDDIASKIDSIF